jgi:hypothetical protein
MLTAMIIILTGLLITPAAEASSSQSLTTNGSPLCFKWHFREYRDGSTTNSMLWEIVQNVYWCNDGSGHFNGKPTVTRSHAVGSLWAWDGWTSVVTALHKTNPSRYEFRVAAALHSLVPLPFTNITEHNYPYIRQTVYPSPGQATWASSCGCQTIKQTKVTVK